MVVKLHFFRRTLHCLKFGNFKQLERTFAKNRKEGLNCVSLSTTYSGAMATSAEVERLKTQAEKADSMISSLEDQINNIRKAAVKQAGLKDEERLKLENEQLRKEIQSLNTALMIAEIKNGVRQVPVPSKAAATSTLAASLESSVLVESGAPSDNKAVSHKEETPQKAKSKDETAAKKAKTEPKAKKDKSDANKPKKSAEVGDASNVSIDVSRLDMRVGKIVAVEKHPQADKLYVEKVDLGEGKLRTIVSGLVDHVPLSAMKDRVAVFMCNLKPVKMREIFSQGMIMCASSAEKTEILVPPADAEIGDRVIFEDYPGVPDEQMNPKKKIWETLKPDVRTNKDRVATYKGCPFTIKGKGVVVAPTLADAQVS